MIEVIEEVCDACIVDVATDDDKLLLVVHLKAIAMVRNDHGLLTLYSPPYFGLLPTISPISGRKFAKAPIPTGNELEQVDDTILNKI